MCSRVTCTSTCAGGLERRGRERHFSTGTTLLVLVLVQVHPTTHPRISFFLSFIPYFLHSLLLFMHPPIHSFKYLHLQSYMHSHPFIRHTAASRRPGHGITLRDAHLKHGLYCNSTLCFSLIVGLRITDSVLVIINGCSLRLSFSRGRMVMGVSISACVRA